jgi:hypothetical protein
VIGDCAIEIAGPWLCLPGDGVDLTPEDENKPTD